MARVDSRDKRVLWQDSNRLNFALDAKALTKKGEEPRRGKVPSTVWGLGSKSRPRGGKSPIGKRRSHDRKEIGAEGKNEVGVPTRFQCGCNWGGKRTERPSCETKRVIERKDY